MYGFDFNITLSDMKLAVHELQRYHHEQFFWRVNVLDGNSRKEESVFTDFRQPILIINGHETLRGSKQSPDGNNFMYLKYCPHIN